MLRKILLDCGIVSSLLYVGADIFGAMRYEGYSYTAQTISELSAIGAPTASLIAPLYTTYSVLMVAFGAGVWSSAGRTRALRVTGALLAAIGIFGMSVWPHFPMHMREALAAGGRTETDTMHVVSAGVVSAMILLAIGFGASAFGRRFRFYSFATIVVLLVSGVLTAMGAPLIEANLPTPWIGVTERINIGGYLLWVVVLAIGLLRGRDAAIHRPRWQP